MVHGAFHGGDRGGSTHPGGSITGAPGRNATIVLLHDLGHDPRDPAKS